MIKLILRTDRTSRGLTFWREDNTPPAEVHDVTGGRATLGLKRWGRRDRNKPVTHKPRPVVGFQAPEP